MNDEYRNRIIRGNALDVLKRLPDKLVDCVITSPPYWSLRDYKTEPVIWGGYKDCRHSWGDVLTEHHPGQVEQTIWKNAEGAGKGQTAGAGQFCPACNAWKGQLGLEPSIELYLDHLLSIFDEVGRVMKEEGTLWVNLGDSYIGGGRGADKKWVGRDGENHLSGKNNVARGGISKSLCLIPQRFAIAMVDRGWILRNTIIWHKPSCMPSSAKDRFTVDFEYVYFFVKQQKYWFEQQFEDSNSLWNSAKGFPSTGKRGSALGYDASEHNQFDGAKSHPDKLQDGRNKRCVWTVNTQPFPEAHFATFPEKLVEPMILAGCPGFVCPECGVGREKIYDEKDMMERPRLTPRTQPTADGSPSPNNYGGRERKQVGLTDCGCGAGWRPGITLDPFIGAGTVAIVAAQNRRDYIGIDLSIEYNELSDKRIFDPKNSQINLL